MELRQLRYFVSVARTLSFTEAARQLFITQGTLSQQLRQLEFELGSDLFVRNSRNVMLTEAGEILLPIASQMIDTAEKCKSQMRDLRSGICGELRIGVSNSMQKLVTMTAKRFLKQYPDVSLRMHRSSSPDLLSMLHNNELDVIVTFRQQDPDPELETKILFISRMSVVMDANNPLAGRESLRLTDLPMTKLVLPGKGLQARKIFETFFSVNMSSLGQCVIANDVEIILDLVRGSDRVALLSSIEVVDRPGLVAVPLAIGQGEVLECREMVCCAQSLNTGYVKKSAMAFTEMLGEQADIERICMAVK
ncbi:MAG: LysR family transcriptional regulator [Bacteroidales bacterium]|nr:LysR family transcriptional regulator [Bacteroidales bacterium]